jgi:hypothetical protein
VSDLFKVFQSPWLAGLPARRDERGCCRHPQFDVLDRACLWRIPILPHESMQDPGLAMLALIEMRPSSGRFVVPAARCVSNSDFNSVSTAEFKLNR